LDLGITLYDTADVYRFGASQRLLGKAFRDRRESVVIATKAGSLSSPLGHFLEGLPAPLQHLRRGLNNIRPVKSGRESHRQDFSPAALNRSIETSLRHLNTDRVDVLLLHNPAAAVLEREDVRRSLERLVERGKVRCVGVSAGTIDVARYALTLPWVSVVQVDYSLLDQEADEIVIEPAARQGVGIMARLVLARGMLTNKRALSTGPRSLVGKDPSVITKVSDDLRNLAEDIGRTLPEIAIRFGLANSGVSSALVGTSQISHLEENLAALSGAPLSDEEMRRIEQITSKF
jgi:aryl-alcohol dehydrogenase-like predicted oxidoreductase